MEFDSDQRASHRAAIEEIAEELGLPVAVVADRYLAMLAQIAENATVTDYLCLLTARRVRYDLRDVLPPAQD